METKKNVHVSALSRRRFIGVTAPLIVCTPLFGPAAPSNRVTLGFIGVGGHGHGYNLKSFLKEEDCRALVVCDCFEGRMVQAKQTIDASYQNKDCGMVGDFREVLDRDDIDGVVISTPDHWHVPLSLLALAAGKETFCEKPTLTIEQGQRLMAAVKKSGKVFSTGLEDRSVAPYHKLAEAVRNGAIGTLHTIHCGLPLKGKAWPKNPPANVPAGFNYQMWLGPAPDAPYTPERVNAQGWRQMRDYSGGTLTDWGAHIMDTAQVGNFSELSGPVKVEGKGKIPPNALNDLPNEFDLTYTYANGVTMHVKSTGASIRFEGDKGWCGNKGWRGGLEAHDRTIFRNKYEDNKIWPMPPLEHRNFLDCIKSRTPTTYTAEGLHRLSSAMHIGNIAMQLGRPLEWDPVKEVFVKDDEANMLRSRPERTDWRKA